MKISDLKRRITFQRATVTTDSDGVSTKTWEDFATVWAAFQESKRGKEFEGAAALEVENRLDITLRFRTDLTTDMRIKYGTHIYHITEMADKSGGHIFLWCRVREVIGGV